MSNPTNSMLRIGIMGFGGAGIAHLMNFRCAAGCAVTKVYDPKPGGLERAHRVDPNVGLCSSLDQFWPDLDAVVVCTPDDTHADYIVQALDRNLHVLCEKPLTDSIEGVLKVKRAAKRSKGVLAVVHQMRFVPLFGKIKTLIDSGKLGRIWYMEGYYVHDLRTRAWAHDNWRADGNATPMIYSGIHFLDLLRWFAGEELQEIYSAANNICFPGYPESDLNVAVLRFKSGLLAHLIVAFGAAGPQDHSVRIYGTDYSVDNNVLFGKDGSWAGTLHSPDLYQPEMVNRAGLSPTKEFMRQMRANLPPVLLDRVFHATRFLSRRPGNEYGARQYPLRLYEHSLACVRAISDFVRAVRTGAPPLCSVDESARAVLAGVAGVQSYRTNKPVEVLRLEDVVGDLLA